MHIKYQKISHLQMDIFHFLTFHILEKMASVQRKKLTTRMGKQSEELPGTVRPRDTRPQAARTLTMHVFE